MLERQANNLLKCRPRAWLSRLMSWRTLTSNIHNRTHTHALNGLTGLVAQANWGNLWPLFHFPLYTPPFGQCIVVARLFAFCSVIRVLSANATGEGSCLRGVTLLIANRIMHFFVPLMRYQSCDAFTVHTLPTHTHTHAQSTQLLSVLIWFIAYSWLAKRNSLKSIPMQL